MNNNIGLFFGSFNPIHVGHLIIANHIVENSPLDKIWFIVSPHSPFKNKLSLARERERLHLVRLAIDNNTKLKASDIEFSLPKPSYTIDTLTYLQEKYPSKKFSLIMGSDNLPGILKWKNGHLLLNNYQIYVYIRPGMESPEHSSHPNVHLIQGPLLDISATFIRTQIKAGKSIKYLVPDAVAEYIDSSNLYK